VGHRSVAGLGPDRVGFAPELLEQEVEAAAHGLARPRFVEDAPELLDVAAQPHQLLGHVETVGRDHDLLVQARLVEEADLLAQLLGAAAQPLADALLHDLAARLDRGHELEHAAEALREVAQQGKALAGPSSFPDGFTSDDADPWNKDAFLAIVKMKKTAQGEPQQAIMAALGTEFYTKYVIVVDEDVDIFDMNDVMWAVATRVHAEKDIVFIPGCKGAILDPTSDPETFTVTKMGIDATRPSGKDFAERLVISEEQRARVRGILEAAGVKL